MEDNLLTKISTSSYPLNSCRESFYWTKLFMKVWAWLGKKTCLCSFIKQMSQDKA